VLQIYEQKQSHELHYVDDRNQLVTYSKPSLSPHTVYEQKVRNAGEQTLSHLTDPTETLVQNLTARSIYSNYYTFQILQG